MKKLPDFKMLTTKPLLLDKIFLGMTQTNFRNFCSKAGAPNIFKLFFMTCSGHTKSRKALNKKRCVALIMQLCFGLSQKCDFFQIDNGILLKFSHCTNDGIDTQRAIGGACSSRTVERALFNNKHLNCI